MRQNDAAKGGRPAMGPKTGKGSAFATRITPETRALLDAEADASGQSISQVAEQWLEQAYEAKDAGRQVGDALLAMGKLAKRVRDEVADPEQDALAKTALLEGWSHLIRRALPFTPGTPEMAALEELRGKAEELAQAIMARVGEAAADDPVIAAMVAPQMAPAAQAVGLGGGLFGSSALAAMAEPARIIGPSLLDAISRTAEGGWSLPGGIADRIEAVAALGSTGADELAAMASLGREYDALIRIVVDQDNEAKRQGREVAGRMLGVTIRELPPFLRY